jgi:hypothetical protein
VILKCEGVAQEEFAMSFKRTWFRDKLKKKAKRGFQGYPVATITYYGPDDRQASKVAVGIILEEGGAVAFLERWSNEMKDIRLDPEANEEIVRFISKHGAKSVVMPDRILGCPHEEGKDYPEGEKCPKCSYWAIRDRFTGKIIQ